MADKKDFKKDDKKAAVDKTIEVVIFDGILLILGLILLARIASFFSPNADGAGFSNSTLEKLTGGPNGWFANLMHFVNTAVSIYVTAATIYSIIVFLAILYIAWLRYKLSVEEKKKDKIPPAAEEIPSLQSQKWQKILDHVNSLNPAEWRLSVLEADVLLDEMLQSFGFVGATIGERLKSTTQADFKTIDSAWEAHKIRNAIAHEGSDFLLSQRESKRVIGLYEVVFKEFSYI